jgi:hypothetical protein
VTSAAATLDAAAAERGGRERIVGAALRKVSAADPRQEPPDNLALGYSFAEALAQPLTTSYLVKNVLRPYEITVLFGESGALKSFAAMDVALHFAAGLESWLGNRVRGPGGVLFLVGEGAGGFPKRLKAWALERGVSDLPAYVYPAPVDIFGGPDQLQRVIEQAEAAIGCRVGLVVIDPLSVMFGEGDESKNPDAARTFSNLRMALGSERSALAVHHVGHGDKGRERGAYQIRSNADARFLVEYEESSGIVSIGHLKEKEGARSETAYLAARVVVLGTDDDGDPISSLVLTATEDRPTQATEWKGAVKQSDQKGLRVLGQVWLQAGRMAVSSAAWRQELYRLDMLPDKGAGDDSEANRKAFQRMAKVLRDAELVCQSGSGKSTAYSPATPGVEAE